MYEYVSVIGGANIDILGTPFDSLKRHDSNPGKININLGGVGRNIAENLSRLGVRVEFISIFASDNFAKDIIENLNNFNISIKYSKQIKDMQSSIYLCINNKGGDMEIALSDMEIYKHMPLEFLDERLDIINKGRALVIDGNVPGPSLSFLLNKVKVPIFLDTVSASKTQRIKDYISNIHTLKPNILEAEILSDLTIKSDNDLRKAANIIHNRGIKNLYISLGPKGVYYSNGKIGNTIPIISTNVVNTSGAGDSFIAALVWASLKNFDLAKSAKAGLAASSICIADYATVSPNINSENILKIMKNNWRE